ncbi:MAG: transglycosylase SLT domain-containing protein [Rhodospirillales bacterium]|nr:transglycosylase SLT domain-containing protein [Rhodospirillales bacterium]MCB9965294.1 transglycosylase SLT domain-containing protein [Rhodospirillales bacterium]MCB9972937.1 transglycosylase SLT domain-containing protein [Rhodospirillales bacterium]MCB9980125.1 transglycosylase SLT domain-containing protein [Rhodospirillales bacterium]
MFPAATFLSQNNSLATLSQQAGKDITSAIHTASRRTGVDFGYLLQQANVESSFNPDAKAKTSSASGLYQFLESTWLRMVDQYGEKYGIPATLSSREKLDLRNDPGTAAHMAAEFAADNKQYLEQNWQGAVGATELYLAHFMGAGGAAAFLNAKDANPLQPAADLFAKAANANRAVFFDPLTQRSRTLQEVYDRFAAKFEQIASSSPAPAEAANFRVTPFHPQPHSQQGWDAASLFSDINPSESDMFALLAQRSAGNGAKWLSMSSVDFLKLLHPAEA